MPSLDDYLSLITAEHADKPNFVATVALSVQPYVDAQALLATINGLFDLDAAIGQQLDVVGQWIGVSRYLSTPLQIYFSFDTTGLGFDQGQWYEAFDPAVGVVALDDQHYRLLLRARAAANQWDGTIPGAYAAWNSLFAPEGFSILIQDAQPQILEFFSLDAAGLGFDQAAFNDGWIGIVNGNMTMIIALLGQSAPDPITLALLTGGYLGLVPATVFVIYGTQSMPGQPVFCFDAPANSNVGGFDLGNWGIFSAGG